MKFYFEEVNNYIIYLKSGYKIRESNYMIG